MGPLSRSNLNLEMTVFVEGGGKRSTPLPPTYSTGTESELGHVHERSPVSNRCTGSSMIKDIPCVWVISVINRKSTPFDDIVPFVWPFFMPRVL